MTTPTPVSSRRMRPAMLLAALAAVTIVVAILTPEATDNTGGQLSTYSVAPGGARIAYELSKRLGFNVRRRVVPLDSSIDSTTVHVVVGPTSELGAKEIHRLLSDVRAGGGLVLAVDGHGPITDSLGLGLGAEDRWFPVGGDADCRASPMDGALVLPPSVRNLVWRRPPPGATTVLAATDRRSRSVRAALGVRVGRGRVAVVGGTEFFRNAAVQMCQWGADVVVARVFEFVRPAEPAHATLLFDEYHHGAGTHPGSMRAVSRYLAQTASGHVLLQAVIAGLVLLFAYAPRPIVPRDAARIARRSPLEHADALGRAYADVRATRTATAQLLWGLRRRAGRIVGVASGVDDDAFLQAVARRQPNLRAAVSTVRRALRDPIQPQELVAVGEALREIERHITSSPVTTS